MSPGGTVALVTLLLTNMGTVVAAWLSVTTMRRGVAKENANRRIALEEYTEDIYRYHRTLRAYLLELADAGVIDMKRVDMSKFPIPPHVPRYNGKSS